MLGIGAFMQELAAQGHVSKQAHLVSNLIISYMSCEAPDEVKRQEALVAATALLEFAERHAEKPESDFALPHTRREAIAPVREIITRIVAGKKVSDEEANAAQKFFLDISSGFSVRPRGGCVNGLPSR